MTTPERGLLSEAADRGRDRERHGNHVYGSYRLREAIAAVIKPWFLARDAKTAADELDAARVLWSRYQGMTDVIAAHRSGRYPVLADMALPGGAGKSITARSPLHWNGEHGDAGDAPVLGRDTERVLADVLQLAPQEIGRLADDGVIAT